MSVLFLPPSAGAASVPDASETVKGIIRIATSAEATAGTDDLTSMTPAKVKSVVDAAVVGGVTYQGTFDASSPADLSNASKGDLYIISVAGSYQGQDWAVGDHLLINADMGGTLDPNKIDKVDNTDSVTSVAGRTGAVVLSASDVSGLATVASTGAYSDLTGTPTLATVATTGAYSDLTGTPTLGTAAALDVGTSASNVVQLNGSAQLPAVDGSLLTGITASVAALDDVGDVNITSVQDYAVLKYDSGTSEWIDAPQINHVYTSTTQSLDLKPGVNRVTMASASSITLTLGIPTLVASQGAVFSVLSTGSATNTLTIGSTSWNFDQHQGGMFVATGLNAAYMVSTIDYNQLENLPTLGTAAAEDVGTSAGNVVQLNGSAQLPAVDGSLLTNISATVAALDDVGDVTITTPANTQVIKYNSTSGDWENGAVAYADVSGTPSLATVATTGAYSDLSGLPTLGTAAALDVGTSATNVVQLDGSARLPAVDGSQLTNLPSGASTLGALTDVTITSVANTQVIKYNSTSGDWENGAVAYADVSGTPSLATVATTGAYSDLSGLPTLGTAAALDVGTSANNVVQLDGTAKLPAVDGSQLTNLPSGASTIGALTDVTITTPINNQVLIYNSTSGDWENGAPTTASSDISLSSPSSDVTLTAPTAVEEIYIYTPSTAITVNLVAAATCGSGFKYQIKNRSANTITINPNGSETIDGAATFALNTQEASITLITDGSNWFII